MLAHSTTQHVCAMNQGCVDPYLADESKDGLTKQRRCKRYLILLGCDRSRRSAVTAGG